MRLDEMKLAVCEKLPKLIETGEYYTDPDTRRPTNIYWFRWKEEWTCEPEHINWPTEGLQVCHEAEKSLTMAERMLYGELMWQLTTGEFLDYSGVYYAGESPSMDYKELFPVINATYEQRLEALCRVWYPERFN